MENILQVVNNQVVVSTLTIAEHTNKEHKNLRELIENNILDFNEFGILMPIMTKPTKGSLGGKPTKSYNLNEQQYSLLMTFLRNNEVVKKFKINMVKAFFEMKSQLENQSSINDIQKILSELEKQKQEIQNLRNQLKVQEEVNPFRGYYTRDWVFRVRENEYAYTRKDWMLLLNECERTLANERQNRSYTRQLSYKGGAI